MIERLLPIDRHKPVAELAFDHRLLHPFEIVLDIREILGVLVEEDGKTMRLNERLEEADQRGDAVGNFFVRGKADAIEPAVGITFAGPDESLRWSQVRLSAYSLRDPRISGDRDVVADLPAA